MKTDPNELAYPFQCQGPTTGPEFYYGLTKRELFAAMAMQGMIDPTDWPNEPALTEISRRSVIASDALIAELNRTEGNS
jgi:hypothetical protein